MNDWRTRTLRRVLPDKVVSEENDSQHRISVSVKPVKVGTCRDFLKNYQRKIELVKYHFQSRKIVLGVPQGLALGPVSLLLTK